MPICPGGQHTVFARHRRSAGLHGGLTVFSLLLPLMFWLSALASETAPWNPDQAFFS
jgi:hypothetical protein